jgi:hypothetical protein
LGNEIHRLESEAVFREKHVADEHDIPALLAKIDVLLSQIAESNQKVAARDKVTRDVSIENERLRSELFRIEDELREYKTRFDRSIEAEEAAIPISGGFLRSALHLSRRLAFFRDSLLSPNSATYSKQGSRLFSKNGPMICFGAVVFAVMLGFLMMGSRKPSSNASPGPTAAVASGVVGRDTECQQSWASKRTAVTWTTDGQAAGPLDLTDTRKLASRVWSMACRKRRAPECQQADENEIERQLAAQIAQAAGSTGAQSLLLEMAEACSLPDAVSPAPLTPAPPGPDVAAAARDAAASNSQPLPAKRAGDGSAKRDAEKKSTITTSVGAASMPPLESQPVSSASGTGGTPPGHGTTTSAPETDKRPDTTNTTATKNPESNSAAAPESRAGTNAPPAPPATE